MRVLWGVRCNSLTMAQVLITLFTWVMIASIVHYLIVRYRVFESTAGNAANAFEDQWWEFVSGEKGRGDGRHV